jgi:hypothetical protein
MRAKTLEASSTRIARRDALLVWTTAGLLAPGSISRDTFPGP